MVVLVHVWGAETLTLKAEHAHEALDNMQLTMCKMHAMDNCCMCEGHPRRHKVSAMGTEVHGHQKKTLTNSFGIGTGHQHIRMNKKLQWLHCMVNLGECTCVKRGYLRGSFLESWGRRRGQVMGQRRDGETSCQRLNLQMLGLRENSVISIHTCSMQRYIIIIIIMTLYNIMSRKQWSVKMYTYLMSCIFAFGLLISNDETRQVYTHNYTYIILTCTAGVISLNSCIYYSYLAVCTHALLYTCISKIILNIYLTYYTCKYKIN